MQVICTSTLDSKSSHKVSCNATSEGEKYMLYVGVVFVKRAITLGNDDDDLMFNDASTHRVICV